MKSGLRRVFIFSLLFSSITAAHLSADTRKRDLHNQCSLIVGWGDWPPYQYQENGIPKGIQIDLIKQIGKAARCELTFKEQSFSENLESIQNGTIDLTLDTTITPERAKYALFSQPYRNEVLALYVRPQYVESCKQQTVAKLVASGMRLGITRGNLYGPAILEIQQDPNLDKKLIYKDFNSAHYKLFSDNKLDALVEDPAVMAYNIRNDNSVGELKLCKISVSSSTVSLMFSKKTMKPVDVERFNKAIEQVKKTKEYIRDWGWE